MCDEIIDVEETKTVTTNFNEKMKPEILLALYIIDTVSIYCYLIEYRTKQLPYYITNNNFNKVLY